MKDLKTIFGQQIQLKWNHCLQRIKVSNIYYLSQMISLNMHVYATQYALRDRRCKRVLNTFIDKVNESNRKPNKLWVNQGR